MLKEIKGIIVMAKLLNKELKYVCVFVSGYLVFSNLNTFRVT